MDILTAKIVAMIVLGAGSMLSGLAPMALKCCCLASSAKNRRKSAYTLLSALSCFGGGVILATSLTHMLPEVNHMLKRNIRSGEIPETSKWTCLFS